MAHKYIVEVEENLSNYDEWDRLYIPVFMKTGEPNGPMALIPCGYKKLKLLTKEDLEDIPDYV